MQKMVPMMVMLVTFLVLSPAVAEDKSHHGNHAAAGVRGGAIPVTPLFLCSIHSLHLRSVD